MSTLINLIPHVNYYDNMLSYTMYTTLKGKSNSKGPNDLGNASRASLFLLYWYGHKYISLEGKDRIL